MPCDGKNPNCTRRRELLTQLKCLVSSMDRKKPCEWDEPDCPPVVCCSPEAPLHNPPSCRPIKQCKSFDLRASIMYKCECIKRNGLQDRCMMWDCMGRPECMTKLYPVCEPGRTALLKLTELGDVEAALKKLYCADKARENALTAYCRLVCNNQNSDICSNDNSQNNAALCSSCEFSSPSCTNDNDEQVNDNLKDKNSCIVEPSDSPSYPLCVPSMSPNCCTPQPCYMYCPPCEFVSPSFPCVIPQPMCLPACLPPCIPPCVQYCPVM